MKRQLTAREWMLLALLGIILLAAGYMMLFYMPMASRRDNALAAAESCRAEEQEASLLLEKKQQMERELEALFAAEAEPLSIPDYDNLQAVMFDLNSILAAAEDYSLSFGTVDAAQAIIRRSISMTFTTATYASAKSMLQQLHDSDFRCMLDDVNIVVSRDNRGGGSTVSVDGTIVFFEYQADPPEAPENQAA